MTKDEKIKEVMELAERSNDLMYDAGAMIGENNKESKQSELDAYRVVKAIESKLRELIQ